jgi:hypothetical protein
MNDTIQIDDRVRRAAGELTDAKVLSIRSATSGANSRIYRVDTSAGTFALKSYPTRSNDTRSRADVEWQTLRFLTAKGITSVPVPFARDASGQFMLMEWIDGGVIKAHRPDEVAEAADFIVKIFELSADPDAADFPLASEACLSAASIVRQIEERLPLFAPNATLEQFLAETFQPVFSAAKRTVNAGPRQPADLDAGLRRLIPADFGFHNTVRQDGRSRYIDFEYFGWDDPVKITADFLLHPAMQLSADDERVFLRTIKAALPRDEDFGARLSRHLPLFALRWVLILFNPFRRDRVAELPDDAHGLQTLLQDRLTKARKLLSWTEPGIVASKLPS